MLKSITDVECSGRMRASCRWTLAGLVAAALLTFAAPAHATVFAPAFVGPGLDPGLRYAGSPGAGYTVAGGSLTLTLPAGQRTGDVLSYVYTSQMVTGDFTATFVADGTVLGPADLGIVIGEGDFSDARSDIFLNGNSHSVNANIFGPTVTGAAALTAANIVTLKVTRVGNKISESYHDGGATTLLNSGDAAFLGEPTTISLFLLEAFEVANPSAETGSYTRFTIANGVGANVAEPGSLALLVSFVAAFVFAARPFVVSRYPA